MAYNDKPGLDGVTTDCAGKGLFDSRMGLRLFHFIEGRYDVRRRRHMAFRDEWCSAARSAGLCDDYFARTEYLLDSGKPWDMYLTTLVKIARMVDCSPVLLLASLTGERETMKAWRDVSFNEVFIITRDDVDGFLMAMYKHAVRFFDQMSDEDKAYYQPYRCYSHRNEHDLRKCSLYNNRGRGFLDMRLSLLYAGACFFNESLVDFYLKVVGFRQSGRLIIKDDGRPESMELHLVPKSLGKVGLSHH